MPLQEVAEWETTDTGNAGDASGFPDGYFVGDTPKRLREMQAALAKYFLDAVAGTKLTTGTSSVYALAPNASTTDFSGGTPPDDAIYSFKPHVLCSAGAKLSVGSSTAASIKWIDGTVLIASQIGPSFILVVRFSSADSCFYILSPTQAQATTINSTTVQNLINESVQGGSGTFTKEYGWTSRVSWSLLGTDYSALDSTTEWAQSTADPTRVYVVASSALQNLTGTLATGDKVKLNDTEYALAAAPSVVDEDNNVLELQLTSLANLAASVETLDLRFATQTITAADAGDGVPNVAAVETELEELADDDRLASGDASDSLKTKWFTLTRLKDWLQGNLAIGWSTITGKPGFGTAATKDTGTSSGQVPLLNSAGRLNAGLLVLELTQAEFDALTPDDDTIYFVPS